MAGRKKRRATPSYELQGAFETDPLLAKTSPYLKRSPAEIRSLQRFLGLENPPEGVDIRPELSDRLAVAVSGSSGWGHPMWARVKMSGKGKDRHLTYWSVPVWIVAVFFAIWAAERVAAGLANGLSFGLVNIPIADFGSWVIANVVPGGGMVSQITGSYTALIGALQKV